MIKRWSRSLFFKIFLWFWSVVFIAMVVAVLTNNWLKKDYNRAATEQEIMQLVTMIEQERANIAEGRKLWRKTDPGWNLIAVPKDLLSHLPQALEDFAEQADASGKVLYGQQGGWLLIGPLQHQGFLYLAASHAQWFAVFEAQDRVLVLLAALSVVTLLCLVLVWSLTRPIRQLQLAVRQLALGNFDTTELKQVKSRDDETGMLAAEMVNMAVSLKRLLSSHHQLLRDVSHELRSPLTRLQIALAIARKKDPQHSLETEHNRIERAVGQINNLISQILDLARLQQDELHLKRLTIVDMLRLWVEDAELEIQQKEILIEWQLPVENLSANWDWLLIERAFDNLLRNAIRFAPAHSTIKIGMSAKTETVELWVQDQGPGVPEDTLETIFDPFSQVDQARDHASGGYGLGLTLVKRIVELHGGSVVASNQTPGLRVLMTLPLLKK